MKEAPATSQEWQACHYQLGLSGNFNVIPDAVTRLMPNIKWVHQLFVTGKGLLSPTFAAMITTRTALHPGLKN
jgi:hypothetical protein